MSDGPQFARMPWFPRDFASSTRTWPLIARGVYRELLDISWDTGGLPADPAALRAMVGATASEWRKSWTFVESKFPVSSDGLRRNPRLEVHRAASIDLYEKRKKGADKTNQQRYGGRHD